MNILQINFLLDVWKASVAHDATVQNLLEILQQRENTAEVIEELKKQCGKMIISFFLELKVTNIQ